MENASEFKARINNYNVLHGLVTKDYLTEKPKGGSQCMLCGNNEIGHPRGTEYVCSDCTQVLYNATQEEKTKAYDKAISLGNDRMIDILIKFITPKEGKDYEPKSYKTGNNARPTDRKRSARHIQH